MTISVQKIVALPTDDTKEQIYSRFCELPVTITYEALHVELGSRRWTGNPKDAATPNPEAVYRAMPGQMGIWYDSKTSVSWIILPLIPSPEMSERRLEIGDYWGRVFVPYMALSTQFNSHRVTPRLNSIATGLIAEPPVLHFTNELSLVDASPVPDQNDFYEDYVLKGSHLDQQFIDRNQ